MFETFQFICGLLRKVEFVRDSNEKMEFLSLDVFKEILLEVKDADLANFFAVSKKFNISVEARPKFALHL
jgi:hypothetical protein